VYSQHQAGDLVHSKCSTNVHGKARRPEGGRHIEKGKKKEARKGI
jgi:hypothetical protein